MSYELMWDIIGSFCGIVFLWHAVMQAHRTTYRTQIAVVIATVIVGVGGLALFAAAVPDVVNSVIRLINYELPDAALSKVHETEVWAKPLGWALIGLGFAVTSLFERRQDGDRRHGKHRHKIERREPTELSTNGTD